LPGKRREAPSSRLMTRQSIALQKMDARVQPAHDVSL
jgi:hypothetical protein